MPLLIPPSTTLTHRNNMFQINDKVVCVDADPGPGTLEGHWEFPNGYLKKYAIYVITGARVNDFAGLQNSQCVLICGVPCLSARDTPAIKKGEDSGFQLYRFRLLADIQEENRHKIKQQSSRNTRVEFGGGTRVTEPWNEPLPAGNPLKKIIQP